MYHTWENQRAILLEQLAAALPAGEAFILIDDDQLGLGARFEGRRIIPFLERDGHYWGPPPDDVAAIENLESLRRAGVGTLVIAWPSFWWLDQYGDFDHHIRATCAAAFHCPHGIVFDLRNVTGSASRNTE